MGERRNSSGPGKWAKRFLFGGAMMAGGPAAAEDASGPEQRPTSAELRVDEEGQPLEDDAPTYRQVEKVQDAAKADALELKIREMEKLAGRSVWQGVERMLVELLDDYEEAQIPGEVWNFAAQASRNTGQAREYYQRLVKAAELGHVASISELEAVKEQHGEVTLKATRKSELTLADGQEMPFLPDQRAALEGAMAQVQETGEFNGILPKGMHLSLDGNDFIVGDQPIVMEVDRKGKMVAQSGELDSGPESEVLVEAEAPGLDNVLQQVAQELQEVPEGEPRIVILTVSTGTTSGDQIDIKIKLRDIVKAAGVQHQYEVKTSEKVARGKIEYEIRPRI